MDPAGMVRDMVKWDDTPGSLQHFAESAVRAYKMAMTEPRGPVVLVVDATLQERPVPDRSKLHIPKLTLATSACRRCRRPSPKPRRRSSLPRTR